MIPIADDGPGSYLVLADDWDATQFPLELASILPGEANSDLQRRLATGTGLANIGLQGLNGMKSVQGLVRLAPETLKLMQAGATPLTSGGANLGTLAANGKIVAQVRWLPATGATAVGVAAALGPAIALAAIQFQLAAMDKKLDRIIRVSDEILVETRTDYWTEVEAAYRRLLVLWAEARAIGTVNDNVMNEARGKYDVLSHRHAHLLESVRRKTQALAGLESATARREWLRENAAALFRDVQCLVASMVGSYAYEVMRSEHASSSHLEQSAVILERAQQKRESDSETTGRALTQLTRSLHLLALDPGSSRWIFLGKDRAPAEVLASVGVLATAVRGLGIELEQPKVSPSLIVYNRRGFSTTTGSDDVEDLKWHLRAGESLEYVFQGSDSTLCLTSERVFRTKGAKVTRLAWSVELRDVVSAQCVEDWDDWNVRIEDRLEKWHQFELGADREHQQAGRQTAAVVQRAAQREQARTETPALSS